MIADNLERLNESIKQQMIMYHLENERTKDICIIKTLIKANRLEDYYQKEQLLHSNDAPKRNEQNYDIQHKRTILAKINEYHAQTAELLVANQDRLRYLKTAILPTEETLQQQQYNQMPVQTGAKDEPMKTKFRYKRLDWQYYTDVRLQLSESGQECQACMENNERNGELGKVYDFRVKLKNVRGEQLSFSFHYLCALWHSSLQMNKLTNGYGFYGFKEDVVPQRICQLCGKPQACLKCSQAECDIGYHFPCFMRSQEGKIKNRAFRRISCHVHEMIGQPKKQMDYDQGQMIMMLQDLGAINK